MSLPHYTARLILLLSMLGGLPTYADKCNTLNAPSELELQHFSFGSKPQDYIFETPPLDRDFELGEISFSRQNIFTREHNSLTRFANRYNKLTRESALLAALPFSVGDRITKSQLAEAERILRNKQYLYDARVFIERICGETIDIGVLVRDVWTTYPRIDISHKGTDTDYGLGVSDINFLGTGKSLTLNYSKDSERRSFRVTHVDPNIRGSRWSGRVTAEESDDGERYVFGLQHPFYSLDTQWSAGLSMLHLRQDQGLYFLNDKLFELNLKTEQASAFIGRALNSPETWTDRLILGVHYDDETIEFPTGFPGAASNEHRFIYPYVAWQRLQDKFDKRSNVSQIGVTEDVFVGFASFLRLGWSPESLSDSNYLFFDGRLTDHSNYSERDAIFLEFDFSGRYNLDSSTSENANASFTAQYQRYHSDDWSFIARMRLTATENSTLDQQLLLGGARGLRGYPSRYQTGDRSAIVSIEAHRFTDWFPMRLFRVGLTAFVDVGRAWYETDPPDWEPLRSGNHFDTLTNIGVGLRLQSVRTLRGQVVHIDIAKPLVDGPEVEDYAVTLTLKQSI